MRAKCAVFGCKAATYNKIGYLLHFHRFPIDPYRQKLWKELSKNPRINPKSNRTLWMCSLHFKKSCYNNSSLKQDAIPSLNLPVTGFSFYEKEIKRAIEASDDSSDATSKNKGNMDGEEEETTRERVKKELQIEIDENDDCGSVSFSEEEDEADARGLDWVKEDSSSNESQETQPGSSNYPVPTYNNLPVFTGLSPVISGVSTIVEAPDIDTPCTSRVFGIPMRNVIDKVVEDNIESNEDDCSTFAAHVKMRMKNFDPAQRVIAQKLISDIMFMADTKQLQLASSIVNPAPVKQVLTAMKNGRPQKPPTPAGGSFSSYVIDSDDEDDSQLPKRRK